MSKASGTVYRSGTKERIQGATVKAFKDEVTLHTITDRDGNFNLEVNDPGSWKFTALYEGSRPNPPVTASMDQDQSDIAIYLDRLASTEDSKAGTIFFWSAFIGLLVLILLYVVLHLFLLPPSLSASLNSIEALAGEIGEGLGEGDESLQASVADLQASLGAASQNALAIEDQAGPSPQGLTPGQQARIRELTRARALQPFELWRYDPLRYLEILFWGLAGILVSKLIMTGWYLRSQRFYREGIVMHISHIAATPLLVLVTVLLLSLVSLNFSLAGGNELTLDLSDPRIMVAFAFLIGTSPWPLWKFIENAAKRFTSQFD